MNLYWSKGKDKMQRKKGSKTTIKHGGGSIIAWAFAWLLLEPLIMIHVTHDGRNSTENTEMRPN